MADPAKQAQVAERIRTLVATAVRGLKDPRMGMVTITDSRITSDLRDATLFYTVLGTEQEVQDTAAALQSATGHLRSVVGKALGMRNSPSLTFVADTVPEHADRIESLIAEAAERDASVQQERDGAQFAGDSDPYRDDAGDDAK
ncbi:30S ribosome-binding factor RbfA [Haloglycomyces albus]|uniref:30S ribosome-binding factor RbfA n=1 Tax=Haloglycomyces albus TaxID=526067 RepID=UPI0004A373FE|nr:30S ribosome-binding factor RbfA [Haloglycomyces albus]